MEGANYAPRRNRQLCRGPADELSNRLSLLSGGLHRRHILAPIPTAQGWIIGRDSGGRRGDSRRRCRRVLYRRRKMRH